MKKVRGRQQRVLGLVIVLGVIIGFMFVASALAVASWAPQVAHAEESGSPGRTGDSGSSLASAPEDIGSVTVPGGSSLATSEGSSDILESGLEPDGLAVEPARLRGGWNSQLADLNPAPLPRTALTPDPADAVEMVYATVKNKVYRSPFAPANWSYVGTYPGTYGFCWIGRHPHGSRMYAVWGICDAGAYNTLVRSDDWGATWSVVTLPSYATSFAIHPEDPDTLYVGVGGGPCAYRGIWKTTDGGDNWTHIWNYSCCVPASIGISPVDPELIFAGVRDNPDSNLTSYIYRSTNGGSSWSRVYSVWGPRVSHVLPDRQDANKVYAALYYAYESAGVLLSTNKGQSWTLVSDFGEDLHQKSTWMLAQSPADPDTLYKVGGNPGGVGVAGNIWRSTDGGYNWTQINSGIGGSVKALWVAVSERKPDVVYLGGSGPKVYKSTNGGDSWEDFGSGQLSGGSAGTLLLVETQGPSHYLGICPSVAQCGDPVNTSTGNFADEWQDLSIPGPGSSLLVQRTYNSLDSYEGPLGTGWSLNYDMRLTVTETNVVEMKVEDGRRDRYISGDGESFLPPPGTNATLVRNVDQTYTLTRPDQTDYTFSEEGLLTSIVTSNELTTTLSYDGDRLIGVADPTGRTVTFTWNVSNTRITGVEDPLGRTIGYGYDGGNLVTVTGLRGYTATLAYTGTNGLLSSVIEPGQSSPSFVNEYDAEGRVTSQWLGGSSEPMTFSYDPDNRQTTVTDARGNSQLHTYSLQLPLTDREDSYGNTLHLAHNANDDVTEVTDERGNETHYSYDIKGNVTS
nr:hypothetical protein [Anaerolineae bacterium]NIN98080.1 hypothetical protein [Anaerolineae bacterium]NIQ81022.1 hypothetical protein [Anaerolineae bacterium]